MVFLPYIPYLSAADIRHSNELVDDIQPRPLVSVFQHDVLSLDRFAAADPGYYSHLQYDRAIAIMEAYLSDAAVKHWNEFPEQFYGGFDRHRAPYDELLQTLREGYDLALHIERLASPISAFIETGADQNGGLSRYSSTTLEGDYEQSSPGGFQANTTSNETSAQDDEINAFLSSLPIHNAQEYGGNGLYDAFSYVPQPLFPSIETTGDFLWQHHNDYNNQTNIHANESVGQSADNGTTGSHPARPVFEDNYSDISDIPTFNPPPVSPSIEIEPHVQDSHNSTESSQRSCASQ